MPRPRPENVAFHALVRAGRVDWRLPDVDLARRIEVSVPVVRGKRSAAGYRRPMWAARAPMTPDRAAAIVGQRVSVAAARSRAAAPA